MQSPDVLAANVLSQVQFIFLIINEYFISQFINLQIPHQLVEYMYKNNIKPNAKN